MFAPARDALLRDASVVPALEAIAKDGMSADSRELAGAALSALSTKKLTVTTSVDQKHVMLSCEWDCCSCVVLMFVTAMPMTRL